MTKLVCDTDKVKADGEKLVSLKNDLVTEISNYGKKIGSDLAGWNGSSKSSFENTSMDEVLASLQSADEVGRLGEFVSASSKAVDKLEEELSALEI